MKRFNWPASAFLLSSLAAVGCGDSEQLAPIDEPLFAMSSLVTSGDDTVTYVTLLENLDPQEVDYKFSHEFGGQADLWSNGGYLYVAESETVTITKFAVDGRKLIQKGEPLDLSTQAISFLGFWINVFVSPTKAYLVNDNFEYVVWNPTTMKITKTIPLPALEPRDGLNPVVAYGDRAAIVRDGLLYQAVYYTNDDYFEQSPNSTVLVFDLKTEEFLESIEAPCPGIDYMSEDAAGDLYLSSWVFAPGGAAVLGQAATCVAKIARGADTATRAFAMNDATEGREGGVFRVMDSGTAMMSVLHPEHALAADAGDVSKVSFGANWRFWSYDMATGEAAEIKKIDWSAGAAYPAQAGGRAYSLIPGDGYGSTTIYDVSKPASPRKILTSSGWTLRLVELP